MKALSVCQPWAHAILALGKNVENRSWPTSYRGPLLVHASKTKALYDREDADDWREGLGVELPAWSDLPKGAIVGAVDLIDCVRADPGLPCFVPGHGPSVWAQDQWLWVLARPRRLPEPIAYRGLMGLFEVPGAVLPEGFK